MNMTNTVLENRIPIVDISGDAGEQIYNAFATTGCAIITGSYPHATLDELFKSNYSNVSKIEKLCDLHIEFMRTLADKIVKKVGIENLTKENTMSNMTITESTNDQNFAINLGFFTFIAADKQCFEIILDGEIISIPYIPNSFIVTIGDALSRASDGIFKAAAIRFNRYDVRIIPFYYDPAANFIVQEEGKPAITYGEYLSL